MIRFVLCVSILFSQVSRSALAAEAQDKENEFKSVEVPKPKRPLATVFSPLSIREMIYDYGESDSDDEDFEPEPMSQVSKLDIYKLEQKFLIANAVKTSNEAYKPQRVSTNTWTFLHLAKNAVIAEVDFYRSKKLVIPNPVFGAKASDNLHSSPSPISVDYSPKTYKPIRPKELKMIPLDFYRTTAIKALDNDFALFSECIRQMYLFYPKVDHLNEVYIAEENGTEYGFLHYAIRNDNIRSVFLIRNVAIKLNLVLNLEVLDGHYRTPVDMANEQNLLNFATELVRFGARIPFSLLENAIRLNYFDLFSIIRNTGHDFNDICYDLQSKKSIIGCIIEHGQARLLNYLFESGLHVEVDKANSFTLMALDNGDIYSALYLIHFAGASLYIKNRLGLDLMCMAVYNEGDSSAGTVQALLLRGYDLTRCPVNIITLARSKASTSEKSKKILELLVEAMRKISTA